ncbi:Protoheme IX farnesyltransferase, mitochondrial [Clonorchis sinensis]|uniref:Protoheme IX farnesyltransferase, mitochondrial n=1 Tax=Clonorchis sinensis TaxID=79923 RepID=A0A419Q9V3_CLOSI|nr:Protoheme IX farnesyltransferase, mitochondrial [Clonorchis sinensis]
MGFRHLPLFFLVSRSPHAPTLSKQPTRVILCGRHRSMGYSRRYSGLLQLETQSAVSSGSAEQTQSKRLGAPISQISLTPTSVPQSTTDRGIPLESLSVTVGSHTFPEEDSLPSLNNSFLYSTTGSRERMATDPPVTSSVCPVLTSPEQILVPTIPQSLNRSLEVAAGLSKARLSLLVVSTAVVGCVLAASTSLTSPLFLAHPYRTILCLIVGTGLTSAAANTVNQIVEIPYDSQMMRTRDRVLVRGLTNPGRAGLFALGCAGTGLITLCLGTNPLVVWLAAGNMLLYTTLYTPLKQFSQANTWIGALVGGVPPLMGWAAATGEIHSGLGNLAVSQPSCNLRVAWQLGTEWVLQLDDTDDTVGDKYLSPVTVIYTSIVNSFFLSYNEAVFYVHSSEGSTRAWKLSSCPNLDRSSRDAAVEFERRIFLSVNSRLTPKNTHSSVTPFRCLDAIPPEGSTITEILPGCQILDRSSREKVRTTNLPVSKLAL